MFHWASLIKAHGLWVSVLLGPPGTGEDSGFNGSLSVPPSSSQIMTRRLINYESSVHSLGFFLTGLYYS